MQSLVKFVQSCCHGCKIFRAMAKPAPGLLQRNEPQLGELSKLSVRTLQAPYDISKSKRKKEKHIWQSSRA